MRSATEPVRHQPHEIGMIEPRLQDIGPDLAKYPNQPKQTPRIGDPRRHAEAPDLDTDSVESRRYRAAIGHADDHRAKLPTI